MPIDASPAGTLDIENATLRSREIVALTNMVAGNDVVRSGGPALEVYGDPSNGGNEATLQLVSNTANTISTSFTSLTSNAGVFSVKTGTDASDNGTITFGGFQNERLRITSDGNVGVGTDAPTRALEIARGGGSAIINLKRTDTGTGQGALAFLNSLSNTVSSISASRFGAEGGELIFRTAPNDTTETSDNPYLIPERMRIDADGNVGVGTVSPVGQLSIVRDTAVVDGTTYQRGMFYKDGKLQITPPDLYNGYPLDGDFLTTSRYLADGSTDYTAAALGVAYDTVSGSQSALYFKTAVSASSLTEKMRITGGGNVGIGKTDPGKTLDVNGSIRGSTVSCSRFIRNGDYRFGNGWNPSNIGVTSFAVGFHDNDSYVDTIMLNTYADSSGGDANALTFRKNGFSARYYQQSFGTTNDWDGSGGYYRQFDLTTPSDDRLKENEEYITGAVDTLMKLKPQIYDLKYTLNSKTYERAAGVIVQDVWYDTPELRFLVTPGDLAEIPKEAPKRSDDPRDDPDYSKWGREHAYLNYDFFIPYLIKGVQELVSELPRIKTQVSDIIPSTLDNYRGMLVSADTNEIKNGVPKLSLTNKSFDKRCFGVVSNSNTHSIDNEILVDTTGCGEVWVINTDNIKSGDFLTSSNVAGYAMKQNDDLLHNYTVAKSNMDCDFSPNNIIKKRVKQELTNVTYYLKEELTAINKEKYDAIEDDSFKKLGEEVSYYLEYVEVNETGEYDKMLYINKDHSSDMLSTDEWSLLDSNTQSEYISKYYKQRRLTTTEYSELDENSKITNLYELETNQLYYHVYYKETKNSLPDYTIEDIRQEFVNVLDEHGQIQWEDDPSGATEKAYRIRYLDADGNITDEANAVHKAALVGCTYHCG